MKLNGYYSNSTITYSLNSNPEIATQLPGLTALESLIFVIVKKHSLS